MDRRWIHGKQFTPQYIDGVQQFMQFARERFAQHIDILCPCRKCLNLISRRQDEVHDHIHIFGMSATYTRWVHHGESFDVEVVESPEHGDIADHLGGLDVGENDNDDDGMPELIEDLYTAAEEDGERPMFARVLEDVKQALCPGSMHSRFSFIVRLLHTKSYYRISTRAFNALLKLLSSAFPQCQLPKSYEDAKKYLRELGLGYDAIHVCKNNCVLFRKDYNKMDDCPVCGESRWIDATGSKRVPQKVLRHFQLIPRLKRIFASKGTAEDTQWHKLKRVPVDNEMSHPADGEAWKHFDMKFPEFAEDGRNLRLGIATDGFNPFGNMSTSYSMWPVLVMPFNLPPWACLDSSNCFMALLIPGPSSPGKDFDLFMEPLIEELLELWEGVSTYDAFTASKFNLRAAILWCIHDYPARGTFSGRTTKGYYACTHCDKDPLSRSIRNKICYIGHRRFLPMAHPWRRSLLFDGRPEKRVEPEKFSIEELHEQLEKVKDVRPGKQTKSKKRKRGEKEKKLPKIFSRKVSLWKLPYWKYLKLPHNLDVMHIEKNICDNLLGTLLSMDGKTKDTVNARLDLQDMGIRHELHLQQEGNSVTVPPACYVLKKEERIAFCEFLKRVKFPDGFAANLARCISADGCKVQGLKTHSCHILLQRILPAGMRGFLLPYIYEVIAELGNFFRELCSRNLKVDVVKRLKKEIVVILCKLEKIFPPAFFDVMVHLAVHLPDEALLRGPVQYGWMYPIERRLGTLKGFVRNRARPEGSIAEAYVADEALTFCSRYMDDIDTRFNRGSCSGDGPSDGDLSVFMHGVKLIGANRVTYLEDKELDKLVWYVLNNCEEVEPYLDIFREELEKEGVDNVNTRLEKEFPKWFRRHIVKLLEEKPEEVSEGLNALSCGPDLRVTICAACIVNGVRYSTIDREKYRQTQNSGVMTEGTHDGQETEFYGVLKEVVELQYNSNLQLCRSVVLFRCDWFGQGGKRRGIRDDGHFKSINIEGLWYKSDPFILSTQAKKIFYLEDTLLGKNWRVVQKFEHRNMYNVAENEASQCSVHQDENCSDTEHEVQEGNDGELLHRREDCETSFVDANLDDLISSQQDEMSEDSETEDENEEDETVLQYCSENEIDIMEDSDDD